MAEWYSAGSAIAKSWVCVIPTMAAAYQRQLSVPSLQGQLSTSKSWEVNGHTTLCTSPVSIVLRLWLVFS